MKIRSFLAAGLAALVSGCTTPNVHVNPSEPSNGYKAVLWAQGEVDDELCRRVAAKANYPVEAYGSIDTQNELIERIRSLDSNVLQIYVQGEGTYYDWQGFSDAFMEPHVPEHYQANKVVVLWNANPERIRHLADDDAERMYETHGLEVPDDRALKGDDFYAQSILDAADAEVPYEVLPGLVLREGNYFDDNTDDYRYANRGDVVFGSLAKSVRKINGLGERNSFNSL